MPDAVRRAKLVKATLVDLVERVSDEEVPTWAYQVFTGFHRITGDELRDKILSWDSDNTSELGTTDSEVMVWPQIQKAKGLPYGAGGVLQPLVKFAIVHGGDGVDRFKLRAYMTWLSEPEGEEPKVCGLGMRFEPPEETTGHAHRFAHAQLTAGERPSRHINVLTSVPESQPSFPLDAMDDLEMLLSALITVYGSLSESLTKVAPKLALELHHYLKARSDGQWSCWRTPIPSPR